jgi:pyridinium-3,5-biscarboxylic acid mononucleotide sulfurtransferase
MDLKQKLNILKENLKNMQKVLVAYSGGVDSTFLLKVAVDVLGNNALGVLADSETYPSSEFLEAKKVATEFHLPILTINTEELTNEAFVNNPPERCFYCKTELFSKLWSIAKEREIIFLLDGANADDVKDFRPGMKAGRELGVHSPLKGAGLTKEDIRELSKELGLPTWDKPSFACLSSRFPYGHKITIDKLKQIEQAEDFLKSLGFKQVRVRHHGEIARIEIPAESITELATLPLRDQLYNKLKGLGFTYITLDLGGFRSGSMNEVLGKDVKDGFKTT